MLSSAHFWGRRNYNTKSRGREQAGLDEAGERIWTNISQGLSFGCRGSEEKSQQTGGEKFVSEINRKDAVCLLIPLILQ